MRYSLKEGVLFGVIIAVAVLLIRTFGGGPLLSQVAALILVAVVLAVAQFILSLRRARSHGHNAPPSRPERSHNVRRTPPQDPFAHETNQAWTGLSSTTVQEQEQREHAGSVAPNVPSSEAPQVASNPSHTDPSTANRRQF